MGVGETDVCNRALILCGVSRGISSMEEKSAEASVCRKVYKQVFRSLLAAHPWSWTVRVCALEQMDVTVPGWKYLYTPPQDCAVLCRVFSEEEANAPFRMLTAEVRKGVFEPAVATNLYQAHAEFRSSAIPSFMPDLFAEALAYRLAMEICVSLQGDNMNMREHLARFYNEAVQRAAWNDANEAVPADAGTDWADEYVRSRA